MMKNKNKEKMKGQVVLMVLLASALILTLGLSASRITTTETRIDTDQELLKEAFNTAESGIDYYLATGDSSTYVVDGSNSTADLQVSKLGETTSLSFNSMALVGSYEYFWLVDHNQETSEIGTAYYSDMSSSKTVNICSSNKRAESFKIDYFYVSGGSNYGVTRTVMSSGDDGCISGFSVSDGSGSQKSLLLTVTPIDSSAKIELIGDAAFPIQGQRISATGKVEGVNNTVTILNRYNVLLTEGLVSGGDVTSE